MLDGFSILYEPLNQEKHTTLRRCFLYNYEPITLLPKDSYSSAGHSCPPLQGSPGLMLRPGPPHCHPTSLLAVPFLSLSMSRKNPLFSAMSPKLKTQLTCSRLHKTFPKQMWSPPLRSHFPSLTLHLSFSLASPLFHLYLHRRSEFKPETNEMDCLWGGVSRNEVEMMGGWELGRWMVRRAMSSVFLSI